MLEVPRGDGNRLNNRYAKLVLLHIVTMKFTRRNRVSKRSSGVAAGAGSSADHDLGGASIMSARQTEV